MERAIEIIAAGGDPPQEPIIPPEVAVHYEPTNYRIPANFPNPPPPAPLTGQIGVRFVLAQCELNEDQINRLTNSGISTLRDLSDATAEDVSSHLKQLARTPAARGGVILGLNMNSKVKAAASFLHELARMGEHGTTDAYSVSIPALHEWQIESRAIAEGDDKITVSPPTTLDPKDWVSFKDGMLNYFRQIKGARKIPLFYVVRDEKRPTTPLSFMETRMWNASLSGAEYDNDNARVFQQLVQVLRDTDAYTYVAETMNSENGSTQDGRAAWQRLCRHYDGPHAVEKRIALANRELDELYYKSEAACPLERYVTRMSNCFRILEQNGAPKSERDKMKYFLDNIKNPNEVMLSFMSTIKTSIELKQDFRKASDSLLEVVGSTSQLHERGATGNNRKVANVNAKRGQSGGSNSNKKKKGRGGGQGPPRGTYKLEERNGKKFCNGVDISDPKRTFTNDEYGKLGDYIPILKADRKVASANSQSNDEASEKRSGGSGGRFGTGANDA